MKMLIAPDAAPRVIAPTTTEKFAERMLSASREIARAMPRGFYTPTALDILLVLHVAEDQAQYPAAMEMVLPGSPSAGVTERWLAVLASQDLIDRRGELVALSGKGHELIVGAIEAVYVAQRSLD